MNYIFETKTPSLLFLELPVYNFRTYCYKVICDTIQWIPRFTFLLVLTYLFIASLRIRILDSIFNKKDLEVSAELAAFRANNVFQRSVAFWYKTEMKIEQLIF